MWFSSPVMLYCTNPVAFGFTFTVIVMSSSLIVMFVSIVVFLSGISSTVNVLSLVFALKSWSPR